MRKYHQEQLLELINTLHEAQTEIRRLFSNKEMRAMTALLSDCQESAIRIGKFIEQLEGEGTKTVSFLEKYCELLYQFNAVVADSAKDNGLLKQLQKHLFMIENSIKTELKPDRIEMVFFPYKGSMWDSMESIWLAAKEDPQCDAYVVPIPYFDKLPSGEFGQMHYEGDRYPDYVPIVDWQSYDIEARRPDVIFVHNPYDGGNFITSVHPDHYSERLKKHTQLLAYVPYFVVSADVPKIFCVLAGTLYADKVFVQSNKVRETYVEVFEEFIKKNNCAGRFGKAEAKFLASGSPKFDKAINSTPEDFIVPEEWQKLIALPDGMRKKIVLYNTSTGAILQGNEQYVKKLQHVIDTFRGRDDVVLWWRPHPLNEITYESMRPQLLNEYKRIVAEYRQDGFGIYDETADLHRAIKMSSCYYGDSSSLVALYQCTGKPVILQNVMITKENECPDPLTFENFYDDGTHFWFSEFNANRLFRMDKQTWSAEYQGNFIDEPQSGRLYHFISECAGKLFFAPFAASAIGVFDTITRSFSRVEIREPQHETRVRYNPSFKFSFSVVYNDRIFFFPATYPAIIRYNLATGELDYYDEWIYSLDEYVFDESNFYFYNGHVEGSNVTMFCSNSNVTVVFDMETCTLEVIAVYKGKNSYGYICYDGEYYWLSPLNNTAMMKLNTKTGEQIELAQFPAKFVAGRVPFCFSAYANDTVWMLPGLANESLKINVETNSIEVADVFQPESIIADGASEQWKFSFLESINDKLYAFDNTVKKLIEYNIGNNSLRKESITVNKNHPASLSMIYDRNRVLYHNTKLIEAEDCIIKEVGYSIGDLLDLMAQEEFAIKIKPLLQKQTELRCKDISHADGKAGKAIYDNCKKAVMI